MLTIFETAVRYQMYHALAAMFAAIMSRQAVAARRDRSTHASHGAQPDERAGSTVPGTKSGGSAGDWWIAAGWCFLIGTILFSGSLYVLALSGVRGWGAVTPFGGAAFLAGWGMGIVAAIKARSDE